jgi:ubiquinone/menaquinone biosynthesis C-methylase UbiE
MRSEREASEKNGDYKRWDKIWTSIGEGEKVLYSKSQPKSLPQLLMKFYFEDLHFFIKKLLNKNGICCLELGSGRGTLSMYLADDGHNVTLVDLSKTALALADSNFKRSNLKSPHLVNADVRNTELKSEDYECVFSVGLLEHFENPKPVLKEALRLLKKDGLLFMVVVPKISPDKEKIIEIIFSPIRILTYPMKFLKNLAREELRNFREKIYRTDYNHKQYRQWLQELGAKNISAIAYNAYHEVYKNELGRSISIYIYRLHHAVKRVLKIYPLLRTSRILARCHLLICSK